MYFEKTVECDFTAVGDGSGYWGLAAGQKVHFTRMAVSFHMDLTDEYYEEMLDSGIIYAELRAFHNDLADENGEHPLPYTDKGVSTEVSDTAIELFGCVGESSGSEQGMQDYIYLSHDINVIGLTSIAAIEAAGFVNQEK